MPGSCQLWSSRKKGHRIWGLKSSGLAVVCAGFYLFLQFNFCPALIFLKLYPLPHPSPHLLGSCCPSVHSPGCQVWLLIAPCDVGGPLTWPLWIVFLFFLVKEKSWLWGLRCLSDSKAVIKPCNRMLKGSFPASVPAEPLVRGILYRSVRAAASRVGITDEKLGTGVAACGPQPDHRCWGEAGQTMEAGEDLVQKCLWTRWRLSIVHTPATGTGLGRGEGRGGPHFNSVFLKFWSWG